MAASNRNQNQNDNNCVSKADEAIKDSSINSNVVNVNSRTEHPVAFSPNIKKKSSTFLHRDYNRKPMLAKSQVSRGMALACLFSWPQTNYALK